MGEYTFLPTSIEDFSHIPMPFVLRIQYYAHKKSVVRVIYNNEEINSAYYQTKYNLSLLLVSQWVEA